MILAAFPAGVTNITVNGLHQWDYGQQLKIKASDLSALVEVHFACVGMDEAIVRPCSMVGGEGMVAIPDKCLEQTSPVHAWIYEINGTTGATTKTIVLNILERTRPQTGEDIPVEISDKYTEAITAMNEAVGKMEQGEVVAKQALQAYNAETAGSAYTAERAYTSEAVNLEWNPLYSGYLDIAKINNIPADLAPQKIYVFNVKLRTDDWLYHKDFTFFLTVGNGNKSESTAAVFSGTIGGSSPYGLIRLQYDPDDKKLWLYASSFEAKQDFDDMINLNLYTEISYCKLGV